MAKLKVFTWSDGFHAYTVATASRAKALAAWDVERDLFKDGEAREVTEGDDHDSALNNPGEVIKRGVGVDVGKISRVAKPKAPKKADVERVAALEQELADLRAAHDTDSGKLEDRRQHLDAEAAALDRDFEARSSALSTRLDDARRKLRKT